MADRKESIHVSEWYLRATVLSFSVGVILAVGGLIYELIMIKPIGLIMIVSSPLLMGAAGVFATLGAKHESKELKSQGLESKAQESKAQ